MSRIREYYKKFKELWKDPKTHNIMVLCLWFIFITVAIVIIRSSTSTNSVPSTEEESFDTMTSYSFTYKTDSAEINGDKYNDYLMFYIDNHRYYYNGNTYLVSDGLELVSYDLGYMQIDSEFLNNLLSGIDGYMIEEYSQYIVPLDRFINLYDVDTDIDLSSTSGYNITVNVYEDFSKVVIDLTNYNLFKGINGDNLLTIYFYNINGVNNFTDDFEEMLGVE